MYNCYLTRTFENNKNTQSNIKTFYNNKNTWSSR